MWGSGLKPTGLGFQHHSSGGKPGAAVVAAALEARCGCGIQGRALGRPRGVREKEDGARVQPTVRGGAGARNGGGRDGWTTGGHTENARGCLSIR